MTAPPPDPERRNPLLGYWREHPIVSAVFGACILGGAVCGAILLTDDWSVARRLAAGAVAGAGVALLLTAPRMVG